jgi:hypothetical protein
VRDTDADPDGLADSDTNSDTDVSSDGDSELRWSDRTGVAGGMDDNSHGD